MITRRLNLSESVSAAIQGVVTAVPKLALSNDELGHGAETAAKMTGVRSRRHADLEDVESMCIAAATRLMSELSWQPESIGAMVCVTQTPRLAIPASGYTILHQLGLRSSCPVIEVNWSCAGYVYGLWLAMKLAAGPTPQRVLLLVGDKMSAIVDPEDRATGPLFGDACSATAVVGVPNESHFVLGSDGGNNGRLSQGHGEPLFMDGAAVMSFALHNVPPLIEDILDISPSPDFLLFHQANRYMLDQVVRKAKLLERFTPAQIPSNVERFGNCSCASIPLLLCDMVGAAQARRSRLALFGFGAGWAWGGAVVSGYRMDVCELIEV